MSTGNWESMKFNQRECSKRLDSLIKEITRVSSELTRKSSSISSDESSMLELANDLTQDFNRLYAESESALNRMASASRSGDPARMAQVTRFREHLMQQRREWTRVKDTIEHERRKSELFAGTRERNSQSSDAHTLLKERGALGQSIGMIESTIESASSAGDMLKRQNQSLSSFAGKLGAITSSVPFISSLVRRIDNRQFQEKLILSLVVGVCISILIWMRLLR